MKKQVIFIYNKIVKSAVLCAPYASILLEQLLLKY